LNPRAVRSVVPDEMATIGEHLWGRGRPAAVAAVLAAVLGVLAPGLGSAGAAPSASASRKATVVIAHFAFSPTPLRVRRGTKVVFSNRSSVSHTATRRGSFNTGTIRPGHAVAIRFQARGTYAYRCLIHPSMHGKIIVR
jgi:plastocyanin